MYLYITYTLFQLTVRKEFDWQAIWPNIKSNLPFLSDKQTTQESRLPSVDFLFSYIFKINTKHGNQCLACACVGNELHWLVWVTESRRWTAAAHTHKYTAVPQHVYKCAHTQHHTPSHTWLLPAQLRQKSSVLTLVQRHPKYLQITTWFVTHKVRPMFYLSCIPEILHTTDEELMITDASFQQQNLSVSVHPTI